MNNRPTPDTDAAEAKRRAEWLHKHKAHKDWIILSVSEIAVIRDELLILERERDEAQNQLSQIHRWIERNHADGFIDSLTFLQNLERVVDCWHDRIDAIESDARRYLREGDEAREKAERYRIEANAMMMQRDEAREALRKAIRFVDAYEPHSRGAEADQNETLSIIRKVLEGVK